MPMTRGRAKSIRWRDVCQCMRMERFSPNPSTRGPPGPLVYSLSLRALRRGRGRIGRHGAAGAATGRRRAWREVLGRTRILAGHDVVQLLPVDGFPLEQGLGHGVHLVLVVLDQLARQRIFLVDDPPDLLV